MDERMVEQLLSIYNGQSITFGTVTMSADDLRLLKPKIWLNDNILDCYVHLLQQRCILRGQRVLVQPFTFFSKLTCMDSEQKRKMLGYRYHGGADGYTKKSRLLRLSCVKDVDARIFSFEMALLPLQLHGDHWAGTCIDFVKKDIIYADSMDNRMAERVLEIIVRYLKDELEKSEVNLDVDPSKFSHTILPGPLQKGPYDCGVFALCFLDWMTSGMKAKHAPIGYGQSDVAYVRHRIVAEFSRGSLFGCPAVERDTDDDTVFRI